MDRPGEGHAGRRVTALAAGGLRPGTGAGTQPSGAGTQPSGADTAASPSVLTRLPAVAAVLGHCTFPPAGTALACAVSGGPDSLALLVLAVAAGCRVTAVHVDHGLRAGSASEAAVVAGAARRLGAGFRG
ncbi:MAG: ATP-binding protein, partial [Acidimicrobiales bacterium]